MTATLFEDCSIFNSLLVTATIITDRVPFAIEQKLKLLILNGFIRLILIFFEIVLMTACVSELWLMIFALNLCFVKDSLVNQSGLWTSLK